MSNSLQESYEALLFAVRRSVRYHDKRQGFFGGWRDLADLAMLITWVTTTILLADQSFGPLQASVAWTVSIASATFIAIALICRVGHKAGLHESLKQRFIALEAKVIELQASITADAMAGLTKERLAIEKDELPILRVVDTLCHNELLHSMRISHEDPVQLSWAQRLFAPYFDYRVDTIYTNH